jgi:hypothetical protein
MAFCDQWSGGCTWRQALPSEATCLGLDFIPLSRRDSSGAMQQTFFDTTCSFRR